jgi:hypothetical protein
MRCANATLCWTFLAQSFWGSRSDAHPDGRRAGTMCYPRDDWLPYGWLSKRQEELTKAMELPWKFTL